jgi:hypothetical protein
MIMGRQTQTGVASCGTETPVSEAAGCGCETGSVLQNGGFNFGQILAASMLESKPLSNTSTSYNPLNSMTPQDIMNGGYLSELTDSQNSELLSATSSAMFGGSLGTAELSATSYSMSQNASQQGGSYNNSMYSVTSPLMSYQNGGSLGTSQNEAFGTGSALSMTSSYGISQDGGNLSMTSSYGISQDGGNLSATSSLPIQYDSLFGGKHNDSKKKHKHHHKERNSSSSSPSKSGSSSSSFNIDDVNASSSSSKSPSEDDSDAIIARAIARNSTAGESTMRESVGMSDTTRELARMSDNKSDKKADKKHSSKHSLNKSTSSNTSSSSTSTNTSSTSASSIDSSDSGSSISSSSTPGEAIGKVNSMRYNNLLLTSPNSATRSESLVNAKQFYSSENGDLYSSESNFLRNNISRNRVR